MRTISPALQTLLDSNQFVICNLYKFTFVNGQVFYWTDADIDIVASGSAQVYSSVGPQIKGAKYHIIRGLSVDSLDLEILTKSDETIFGVTWPIAARSGALDNAQVEIYRAFLSDWSASAEKLLIFKGSISVSAHGEISVSVTVVSDASKLNIAIPKLKFQSGCMRTVYDAGCAVSKAAFQESGVVTGVTSNNKFVINLAKPDDYYSLGYVVFTSGLNAGVWRSVKQYRSGSKVLELSLPTFLDVAIGDTFLILPGCDRTQGANGCAKFANLARFKATPNIPAPETIT
jgi:uncharacterized phage protein (TIGR02218 family)